MSNDRFRRWIFESYHPTTEGLALYRIFTALMFLFFLMPDATYYSDLANFPDDFFSPPPGPMMFFSEFPPAWFLYTVHALLALSWIGVLLGYKTRFCTLAAAGFMLVLMGFIFSIGKVNHLMLLVLVPAFMAFSNWGAAYSVDSSNSDIKEEGEGWPLVLLALLIGFMFFTAGFPKILGGWLDPDSMATRGHLLNQYFVRGRTELLSGFAVDLDLPWVWLFLDWATIVFEVGFLVAVLRSSWTRLFVCFAVVFHFFTMLTLNIAFLHNFPAYAAFLPWNRIHDFISQGMKKNHTTKSMDRVFLACGVTLFLIFTVIKIIDETVWLSLMTEPSFNDVALIGAAVCIVTWFSVRKGLKMVYG